MAAIAVVGLGQMGGGMAARLVAAGHHVTAFDLVPAALDRAAAAGCTPAASLEAAAQDAEAVLTMLPMAGHVRAVHDALRPLLAPGTLLVDCSTIDVASARALAEAARDADLAMVDAPVSGGIAAAAAGTLTFMVGGTEGDFERAQPVLAAMGQAVIHAGGNGAGQAAKLCNNLVLGATMIATCEAFLLAGELGLKPETFYAIAARSSAQSWSLTSYCPVPGVGPESPADRGYEGGFSTALMLKDLKLALAAAHGAGVSAPMGAAAEALYQAMANAGGAARDFSAMIRFLGGRP